MIKWRKSAATRWITGTTSWPPGTARAPPSQKSFCTSITRSTSRSTSSIPISLILTHHRQQGSDLVHLFNLVIPTSRLAAASSATKAGCPIQARFWLEWDTTALDVPFSTVEDLQFSDSVFTHRGNNFLARVVETPQNLKAMLAQQWWGEPVQHRRGRKPHRVGDTAHHIEGRVLDLHDQSSRQCLRIVDSFAHRVDRRRWDILRAEPPQPLVRRGLIEDRGECRNQRQPMFRTQRIVAKAWVSAQCLRRIDDAEKPIPQRIGADGGDKMAPVSAAKHLVGNNAGMRVSPALWRFAGVQIAAARIDEQCQLRIEEGHIQRLAGPG